MTIVELTTLYNMESPKINVIPSSHNMAPFCLSYLGRVLSTTDGLMNIRRAKPTIYIFMVNQYCKDGAKLEF